MKLTGTTSFKAGDKVLSQKNRFKDQQTACAWTVDANVFCQNTAPHGIQIAQDVWAPCCDHHFYVLFEHPILIETPPKRLQ